MASSPSRDNPVQTESLPGTARLWLFRLLALVVIPIALLTICEIVLRLAGVGYNTSFFKPLTIDGKSYLVENDRFGLRFFPAQMSRSPAPLRVEVPKPPGVFRIVLLGESAALGDPAPAFGFGRYLEILLQARHPEFRFEVVCVAMTAINSHSIFPIARDCRRLNADAWILYMGNNEMVGPYGAATVFGRKAPPGWFIRSALAAKRLRLVQAMEAIITPAAPKGQGRSWEGMKLFVENQIRADDPAKQRVYSNFEQNLTDILQAGVRSGIPILLSTVAANLRDCSPFGSLPFSSAGTNAPVEFGTLLTAAGSAVRAEDWNGAIQALHQAQGLVPGYAEVEFRLANVYLALTNFAKAREHFVRACDFDALPFRADSKVNNTIRSAARAFPASAVELVDVEQSLSGPYGTDLPGSETFFEHVHFTPEGNYRLARIFAGQLSSTILRQYPKAQTSDWLSAEQSHRHLGLTDWNRKDILDNVIRRLQQPPFSGQSLNNADLNRWRKMFADLDAKTKSVNFAGATQIYINAIARRPDDYRLRSNYADFLEAVRDLKGATEQWRKVRELIPHHHLGDFQVGRLLSALGDHEQAEPLLLQAVLKRPDLAAAWYELGVLASNQGQVDLALSRLNRARELIPQDPRIPYQAARALLKGKRLEAALEQARDAIRLDPQYWEPRALLGEELAFTGRLPEAQAQFEALVSLRPDFAWAHLNLGVALFKRGDPEKASRHLEEALRLDPKLALARNYLAQIRSRESDQRR